MAMHRNKKLLFSLAGLLTLILVTWWVGMPSNNSVAGYDLIGIADTTFVEKIEITSGGQKLSLMKGSNGWTINEKFKVDPAIRKFLLGVIKIARVKREVGKSKLEEVKRWMESGRSVSISLADGKDVQFEACGNPSKTESYFKMKDSDQIYMVELPGYPNYVTGIFEFTENQWRDRLLFSSDWRTIQSLTTDYTDPNLDDVIIAFDKTTLKVNGSEATDTIALEAYIQQFEAFFTNEYISQGQIDLYDSLMQTSPIATITLRDIDTSKNTVLEVFGEPATLQYLLLKDQAGNYSVCESARIAGLLPERNKLIVKKQAG